jgi:hypothetical protein
LREHDQAGPRGTNVEHEHHVIKMNVVRYQPSGRVQRVAAKVHPMIYESGHPADPLVIPLKEETTMLKTISAALLAVSVIAAPALAANSGKTTQAPVIKAEQTKQAKSSVLNANAKMGRHHAKHVRHHRMHKHMGAFKSHKFSTIKQAPTAAKRG